MGGNKNAGIALLVVGVIVLVVSLAADKLGLGAFPGFGSKQLLGCIAGVVGSVAGLGLYLKK